MNGNIPIVKISKEYYGLNQFIEDIEEIVRKYHKESDLLQHIRPLLYDLINISDSIPEEAFIPRNDRFADNLIYLSKDKRLSIIGSVWLPGQYTPIHDHLTWALVGMHEGEEIESIYKKIYDDSSNKIVLEQTSNKTNNKGHISVLGKDYMHRIENTSDKLSSSIHVYGIDLGNVKRRSYDPTTGHTEPFATGYDSILEFEK